jgi:hypothetical protein
MTNTIRELMKVREKIVDSINDCQTEEGLMKPGKDSIFRLMRKELDAFDTVIDFMVDMENEQK